MKVKAKTKNESDGLRVYGVIFIHEVCCFGLLLYKLRFHNYCFHRHDLTIVQTISLERHRFVRLKNLIQSEAAA